MISKIFRYLFEERSIIGKAKSALEKVPGPSPWYLDHPKIDITLPSGKVYWESAGNGQTKSGKCILKSENRNLAVFNFHNWIQRLKDSLLLVWNQPYANGPTAPLSLCVFDCHLMEPLDQLENIYEEMTKNHAFINHRGGLQFKIDIPTTQIDGTFRFDCPEVLKEKEEILMLAHSSGVGQQTPEKNNLCIISLRPREGVYEFFPQDWFNAGGYDYGYEWVTKVAREPKSRKICGTGIRINSFILNSFNKKVEKYFSYRSV